MLFRPDGWHTAKTTTLACDSVDKVEWRTRHQGFGAKRIFRQFKHHPYRRSFSIIQVYLRRITATLPASVEKVSALLRNVNNIASWNRTVQVNDVVNSALIHALVCTGDPFVSGLRKAPVFLKITVPFWTCLESVDSST